MSKYVLDASALLALVKKEPGADKVRAFLPHAIISAVNFCETVQILRRCDMPVDAVQATLAPLVPAPLSFDQPLAYVAALIHERTRGCGLSFGDCACLALALSRGVPAVTAEKAWGRADVGVEVIQIR